MRQGIGKDQVLVIRGEVQNGKLKITVQGPAENTKEIAWPDGVIGLSREATILKEKKLRTGESIGYSLFESQLTTIVRYTATAGKIEEIKLAAGEKPRRMMPVKVEMEAIENFKLPPGIVWVDPTTYEQLRLDQDMPQFGGMMTILRSTQEVALRPAGRLLDLAEVQSILLEREVPNWDTAQSMTFRFQLGGDLPLNSAFVSDSRQTVKIVDEKERILELTITAERKPKPAVAPGERPGKEYLDPNYFIDWDQDLVKKHARSAIEQLPAGATDWQKAQAIEKWVRNNMRAVEFSQAMASCSNVAKNLTGDCTEFSMLAAGMCRSLGIPARTAVGLVYAAPSQTNPKPMLAWHMWYEVWIEGQWLALDGTLGQGSVGAAHLKVTQASWHDERSIKPLLPIVNLLGTAPKVEILKVDGR
jgi:hypothetical protein